MKKKEISVRRVFVTRKTIAPIAERIVLAKHRFFQDNSCRILGSANHSRFASLSQSDKFGFAVFNEKLVVAHEGLEVPDHGDGGIGHEFSARPLVEWHIRKFEAFWGGSSATDKDITSFIMGDGHPPSLVKQCIKVHEPSGDGSTRLVNIDSFKEFYKQILILTPRSTFYATSLGTEGFFWDDKEEIEVDSIEWHTQRYIELHGTIRRTFFVEQRPSEHESAVIDRHSAMGVRVLTKLPPSQRRLILVESNGLVGWELTTDLGSDEILNIHVTCEKAKTDDFLGYCKQFWK